MEEVKVVYKREHFGVRVNLPYAKTVPAFVRGGGLVLLRDFHWRASVLVFLSAR